MLPNPAQTLRLKRVHPLNLLGILAVLAVSVFQFVLLSKPAYATTPFAQAAIVHSRLTQSTVSSSTNWVLIVAKTTASEAAGQATVVVTFGADYTVGIAGNFTITNPGSGNCPSTYDITGTGTNTSVTAWPGDGTATNVTGQVVTFPSSPLSASNTYGFCITGTGLTNPANNNNEVNTITANGDSTQTATKFISNDQVVVNATVPSTFTFTLSGNTDNFTANLSTASITNTTGITATAITNAFTGYSIMVKSTNQGLKSATAGNKLITSTNSGSQTTLSNNTEGYVLAVTSKTTNNTGTAAVLAKFDATGGGTTIGGDLHQATYQEMAYANNTTTSDAYTFKERATISGTTPAASDYTDTLTVVGSGNF